MNVCVFLNAFQFIIGIGRLLLFGQAVQCGDANLKSILYVCLNNIFCTSMKHKCGYLCAFWLKDTKVSIDI